MPNSAGKICVSWGNPGAFCDCTYHCTGCRRYGNGECCSCCQPSLGRDDA